MRISDWSSDVCSSDLASFLLRGRDGEKSSSDPCLPGKMNLTRCAPVVDACAHPIFNLLAVAITRSSLRVKGICIQHPAHCAYIPPRSEEHTSELQSLMSISYAVFCLKKKKTSTHKHTNHKHTADYLTQQQ